MFFMIFLSWLLGFTSPAAAQIADQAEPPVQQEWERHYLGPSGTAEAAGMAMDSQGNIIVSGQTGVGSGVDYATIKYSPAGEHLWVSRFMGPGSDNDPAALVLDGQGNVYVTGYSAGVDGKTDYATVKYSPDGEELWVIRYSRAGDDKPVGLALDGQGNVYVTGTSQGPTGTNDITTLKYRQQ